MRKNKIGSLFLVSVLALAGIGVSFAGFSDSISVYGIVDTATVELTVEDYSCTLVWKIWDCPAGTTPPSYPGLTIDIANKIAIYRGFNCVAAKTAIEDMFAAWPCLYSFESWAKASADDCYDVYMQWYDIFPCIDFTADIIIHYNGSIPAHITVGDIVWNPDGYDFSPYTTFRAYSYIKDAAGAWVKGTQIQFPVQMHFCEYVGIEVIIHLPQDNTLQNKQGSFTFNINALQWYECPQT